jgi:hypothetical protein
VPDCEHGRETRRAVEAACAALAGRGLSLELEAAYGEGTRLLIGDQSPFRLSERRCDEKGNCHGFSYEGEFFESLTESVVKEAVLAAAGMGRARAFTGCCGSGCPDCPY